MIIENCWEVTEEVLEGEGVASRSALTAARIPVAVVSLLAARLLFNPTGSNPKMAVRQNVARPRAMVTSIRENAALSDLFIA
jgi:hypothetical protein